MILKIVNQVHMLITFTDSLAHVCNDFDFELYALYDKEFTYMQGHLPNLM